MEENSNENNKLETNELYISINDYINNNIKFSNDTNKNLKQLKKLGRFLDEFQDTFNLEMCQLIISSNDKLSALLKDIIENNMDDVNLNSDATTYLLIDTYCDINNINLNNNNINLDYLDDVELKDFIDNDAKVYIKEVSKIPLLSHKEEERLLIEISYGNKKARKRFLEANLRLVISVALKYVGRGLKLEDLIQEGNLGLMKALDKFDVKRGFKFSTYAVWWIRQTITRAIYNTSRNVRIPVNVNVDISRYKRAKAELSMRLQGEVSNVDIAKELDISEEYAKKLYKHQYDTISINSKINDEEDTELGDIIVSDEAPLEELIVDHMEFEFIKEMFNILTEREALVLNLRLGLEDGATSTLEEVGKILNVTIEWVRKIEAKALRKLKIEVEKKERQEKIASQNQIYMEQSRKTLIDNKVAIDSKSFDDFQKIYNKINTDSVPKKR